MLIGVVTSTCTSPIWVVKTQMQLESSRLTAQTCMRQIYKMDGIRGFYRGLTASYAGVCVCERVCESELYTCSLHVQCPVLRHCDYGIVIIVEILPCAQHVLVIIYGYL